MQKLTLKKISKELDVSISTVSKALRDSPEISEETKQKIKAFANLYNYKPNNIALSLKNRKTKTLGVIIPEIVHYFFTTVIRGIERVANERGYNVIIGVSNESFDKEVINIQMLANGSIDGFIVSVSTETLKLKDFHHITETINQGMPVVMFDRSVKGIECDKVIVDDVHGAREAVLKLIDSGCSNVAIITTDDHVNVGNLRTTGYLNALALRNHSTQEKYILKLDDTLNRDDHMEDLEATIFKFIESQPEIDGIFAVNEKYAIMAMKCAQALGKSIPDDMQLIGFTDGVLSKYATPRLSAVSQHGEQMGQRAAHLLIDRLEQDQMDAPYQTEVVPTELIARESSR